MKTIYKSYNFRIFPTEKQKILLVKHFGACRFIFNYFLNERKEKYLSEDKYIGFENNSKRLAELKKEDDFIWLKEVNSQSLQASIRDLDKAYSAFFHKRNNFPKFKSRFGKQIFRVPQYVFLERGKLVIPKFKEGIKIKLHREVEGEISFTTIHKTKTDKYYASITCKVEHEQISAEGYPVGIDTGIKSLAVLSNGKVYENISPLNKKLKKLKYEQRQLSKKNKGSNSKRKQQRKFAAIHEKITNIRNDHLHKVSTEIVSQYNPIAVEDLGIKKIMENHILSRSMQDVGLGMFYKMLYYKTDWNDVELVSIDKYFPSSKTCSNCGWVKQDLTLKNREWICEECGEKHDRDINAAKNILKQGLNKLSCGSGAESQDKQKQVEALSLDKSMNPEIH